MGGGLRAGYAKGVGFLQGEAKRRAEGTFIRQVRRRTEAAEGRSREGLGRSTGR